MIRTESEGEEIRKRARGPEHDVELTGLEEEIPVCSTAAEDSRESIAVGENAEGIVQA